MTAAETAGSSGVAGVGGSGGSSSLPAFTPGHGPGQVFEVQLDAKDRPVQGARFGLYVPDGAPKLSGVIVHQHGCGRDGIGVPNDLHWQALANRWGMGLLGTTFPTVFPDGDHCERWSQIENGSGDLFLAALASLATQAGHPELTTVPWVLWGHSGGATWVFQVSKKYPKRTLAVVIKSICEADPAFDSALVEIPTLLATGVQDLGQCYPITTQIFRSYRAAGAPWAYVDEAQGSHDSAKLRLLAIPYLDAVIALRLAPAPQPLRAVVAKDGFLADNATKSAVAAADFVGDSALATFLPSAKVGAAWTQFVTLRSVVDESPPTDPPRQVKATKQGARVVLTWQAEADLESGIRAFNVYRDGSLAFTVPSNASPFQGFNYGDEPEPVVPVMSASDDQPGAAYRITSVNGSGLESMPSEPVNVTAE